MLGDESALPCTLLGEYLSPSPAGLERLARVSVEVKALLDSIPEREPFGELSERVALATAGSPGNVEGAKIAAQSLKQPTNLTAPFPRIAAALVEELSKIGKRDARDSEPAFGHISRPARPFGGLSRGPLRPE